MNPRASGHRGARMERETMSEISDLAEGSAFMDAVDDILGRNMALRDIGIGHLRRVWIAGRDYAARHQDEERRRLEAENERLRAALEWYADPKIGSSTYVVDTSSPTWYDAFDKSG